MFFPENPKTTRSLQLAIAASLLLHGLILFVPQREPSVEERPARRLQASLAPRPPVPPTAVPKPALSAEAAPVKPQARKRIIAMDKSKGSSPAVAVPKWSAAEKEDMNRFLRELDGQARAQPSLAQRSLAMASEVGRQQARQDEEGSEILEFIPGSPPLDRFSFEMYLDALVKKLNRSAAFVRNDPRSRGVKTGAVKVRLNPNGSLKSFEVLYAADQQDEIAFIKSVIEQSIPFSAFPADMRRSVRSLNMVICILPSNASGGGFGFTRNPNGRGC